MGKTKKSRALANTHKEVIAKTPTTSQVDENNALRKQGVFVAYMGGNPIELIITWATYQVINWAII